MFTKAISKATLALFVLLGLGTITSHANDYAHPTYKSSLPFKQVVIWGYKLHSHTHSYIHWGFKRAFEYLNYPTYWLDHNDHLDDFDFANTLFITAGNCDNGIPLRDDCFYILHNCQKEKYEALLTNGHAIVMQVYTHDVLNRNVVALAPCVLYDLSGKVLYMPWATDLLPHEIDENKKLVLAAQKSNTACFVGTIWGGEFGNNAELTAFKRACQENGVLFVHKRDLSMEDNAKLVREAYMAPAIQGKWQCEHGYIPCRALKNASYGNIVITNNKIVYDLLESKAVVYNADPYELFFDTKNILEKLDLEQLFNLMDLVRDNHTYITRIEQLLTFFDLIYAQTGPSQPKG